MLCQQIEKLQDEWPNRDIQEQLDDLHKTSVDLLQLIREPTPIIGDVSKVGIQKKGGFFNVGGHVCILMYAFYLYSLNTQ